MCLWTRVDQMWTRVDPCGQGVDKVWTRCGTDIYG